MPLPSGVSTDSGWNWTPSAGSSRWRTPIRCRRSEALRLEHAGQLGRGDQRVVTADEQRVGQAREDRRAVVADLRVLAVDRLADDHSPPNASTIAWCPRQTPSVGMPASGKRRDASTEIPASAGVQGPGEITSRSRPALEQLADARPVVADDLDLGAELAQVLDEVVGERVVVVDHEHAGHRRALSPSPGAHGERDRAERCPRLLQRLAVLVVRLGVGDGAAARLHVRPHRP